MIAIHMHLLCEVIHSSIMYVVMPITSNSYNHILLSFPTFQAQIICTSSMLIIGLDDPKFDYLIANNYS